MFIEIVRAGQAKQVTIIPEDAHFDLVDARMGCLSPEPEITIQPALARHGSGELNFRLEDNTRLYGKYTDRTKPFQRFDEELIQAADNRLFV